MPVEESGHTRGIVIENCCGGNESCRSGIWINDPLRGLGKTLDRLGDGRGNWMRTYRALGADRLDDHRFVVR